MLAYSKLRDRMFDMRYNVDTCTPHDLNALRGIRGDTAHAQRYEATQVVALRALLRRLNIAPGRVLVDFGSGKGRVLLVASEFGFRSLRGVEFSAQLCDIARRNIDTFLSMTRVASQFEVIHEDAAAYAVRDDEDVFFLFNPFDAHILAKVIEHVSQSLAARPRPLLLIYRRPVHAHLLTDSSPFTKTAELNLWGNDFSIFEAGSGTC